MSMMTCLFYLALSVCAITSGDSVLGTNGFIRTLIAVFLAVGWVTGRAHKYMPFAPQNSVADRGEGSRSGTVGVRSPDASSFGFYIKEAFQSQTKTENILYYKSR